MPDSKLFLAVLLTLSACGGQHHARGSFDGARGRSQRAGKTANTAHGELTAEDGLGEDQPRDFSGVEMEAPRDDEAIVTEREIAVRGIEGTMAEYDVRSVLQARNGDFDRCHDQHRGASGRIRFRIHVEPSGDVGEVEVRASNVRSQNLVACYSDVIARSHFAPPHGGAAVVTWTTTVGKSREVPDVFERRLRWDAPSS